MRAVLTSSNRSGVVVPLLVGLIMFVLAGCAAESPVAHSDESASSGEVSGNNLEAPAESNDEAGSGAATFTSDSGSYAFEPSVCIIDDTDAVIHGPGRDASTGEPAYFSLDFHSLDIEPGGGIHIVLGTDQQFNQSDATATIVFATEIGPADGYQLTFDETTIQVEGDFRMFSEVGDDEVQLRGVFQATC